MKILTIVGARPQFIKAAAVTRAIQDVPGIVEVLVHTGQHFDTNMSRIFFDELEMKSPDYHLGISGGGHGAMTGRMLERLDELMQEVHPDWVLVYGDTNSTLAGALAAAKLNVPLAHVEAGLRSFNRSMPEEVNRIMADHCAELLLTPTEQATRNLRNEGVREERIRQVGDVMFDASLFYAAKAERCSRILDETGLQRGGYVLATVHRQENTDDPSRLGEIFDALGRVAREVPVVVPIHPRTRDSLKGRLSAATQGLTVLPPVGYLDMVMLERGAMVIATDSGGVQKEAYFHSVPCVTLREETEWTELVEMGWNRLAPPGGADIADAIRAAIGSKGGIGNPYGSGNAAKRVADALVTLE